MELNVDRAGRDADRATRRLISKYGGDPTAFLAEEFPEDLHGAAITFASAIAAHLGEGTNRGVPSIQLIQCALLGAGAYCLVETVVSAIARALGLV